MLIVCNSPGQLLDALCEIADQDMKATIVYLTDEVTLPGALVTRVEQEFANVRVVMTSDAAEMRAFESLPRWIPAIIRRNIRSDLKRPQHWQPSTLKGEAFDQALVYHTGFFMAKVAAGIGQTVTFRENGMDNYRPFKPGPLKAILRALNGLSPTRQIMGEEAWVTHVETKSPTRLPKAIAKKVRPFNADHDSISANARSRILRVFAPNLSLPDVGEASALLLTQPLDKEDICDRTDMIALYETLVSVLRGSGFQVCLKHHPRDTPFDLQGVTTLPQNLPIEIWPLATGASFDCAVALCSAALSGQNGGLAHVVLQLVEPENFHARGFPVWHNTVADKLRDSLSA